MKNYHFPVVFERDENGYFVFCPDLQGCYSQGNTYEEALTNITDAIKLHIEDRHIAKEELPTFHSVSLSTVEVSA